MPEIAEFPPPFVELSPAAFLALRFNFSARFIFVRRIGRIDSNSPVENRASPPGGDTVDS